jgi:hypothetical protein
MERHTMAIRSWPPAGPGTPPCTAGPPAQAAEPDVRDHREVDMRVEVVVKSIKILDDHDWGTGEFYVGTYFREVKPGCPPVPDASKKCARDIAGTLLSFSADSGETVVLDASLPDRNGTVFANDPTITPEFGFPLAVDGTYTLVLDVREEDAIFSDHLGRVSLTFERGANWALGSHRIKSDRGDYEAEIEVRPPGLLADMRPIDIKTYAVPGSPLKRVCAVVENIGPNAIGSYTVDLRVDGASGPSSRFSAGYLTAGAIREDCTQMVLSSGPHLLTALVDEPQQRIELSETNNRFDKPSVVARTSDDGDADAAPSGTGRPDLAIGVVKLNGREPDGDAGCKVGKNSVAVAVKNLGEADANAVAMRLVVDGDDAHALEQSVSVLAAGQEREVRFGDVRLKKGQHAVVISLDPKGAVAETDENNNDRTVTATCRDAA